MPYKRGKKIYGQVRRNGLKKEKVFQTAKEAKAWEVEMKKLSDEEWNGMTNTVCLADWANVYLDYAKGRFTPKTYDEKRSMFHRFFKHIDPLLPVYELTRAMVLKYIQKQNEERSGYGANKDRKNLVASWHWGMEYFNPILPTPNPCIVEKMPEIRHPRYVPPADDFWKVYSEAKGQDKVMLLTFLHLAGRRGEIFRLDVEDLDFENDRVRLSTRKRKGGNLEYDWLPMTKELRKALLWWLENRPIKDCPYVFMSLDKKPVAYEYYGKRFQFRAHFMKRICKKAKVKPFGFHAIRHLTASLLYSQGHSVATIQALLRHQSPGTTERYLKTLGLDHIRSALDDLFTKKGNVVDLVAKRAEKKKAVKASRQL